MEGNEPEAPSKPWVPLAQVAKLGAINIKEEGNVAEVAPFVGNQQEAVGVQMTGSGQAFHVG